jgi:protease YdgD
MVHQTIFAAICLLGYLVSFSAFSQDLRPHIIGDDDRIRIDAHGSPWDAIGQVNIAGYRTRSMCTGTLIAPDLVLTAAHCVMDATKKVPHPLHRIHFLAGVRGSKHNGHSTAKCLRFLADYTYLPPPRSAGQSLPSEAFGQDVVVIELLHKLAVQPAELAVGIEPRIGLDLIHAAYAADRRYALSAHLGCRLRSIDDVTGLWLTTCDTHPASSGGPFLTQVDNKLKVAAVLSGGSRTTSIGVPISKWIELVERQSWARGKACERTSSR